MADSDELLAKLDAIRVGLKAWRDERPQLTEAQIAELRLSVKLTADDLTSIYRYLNGRTNWDPTTP